MKKKWSPRTAAGQITVQLVRRYYLHDVGRDSAALTYYLLFALAFRWISRLAYVRNPKSHQDIPARLLDTEGNIRLQSDISVLMEAMNGREPTISFEVYDDYRQFRETGYDFVTMAQSPRYAPASADRIMRLLKPYILET